MKTHHLGLALALCSISILPARALVISEVVYNEVSSDTTGEWIEIFNETAAPIDLTNYKIGDEEASGQSSATEAMFQFPAGASIAAGEVQVIAVSATRFNAVYGFMPDYEFTATEAGVPDMSIYSTWDLDGGVVNMSNSNDQAALVDGTDTVIDSVCWGNNFSFTPGLTATVLDGQSYQRINPYVDTNTGSDWEVVPGAAAAQRSTPGVVPTPKPTITGIIKQGAQSYLLQFSGQPGFNYTLQMSTDLTQWTNITSVAPSGTNTTFEYQDTNATNSPAQFYRLKNP